MAKLTGKNALICGDSRNIIVSVPSIDLTGYTVTFTVKAATALAADTDASALIQKTVTSHTSPTTGVTTIELSATDTRVTPGKYVFDIQFDAASGATWSIKSQDIEFVADVTKA